MERSCFSKSKLRRMFGWLQIMLGVLVIIISFSTLLRFYEAGFFLHEEDLCSQFYSSIERGQSSNIDVQELRARIDEVLDKMESLQTKLESTVQLMGKTSNEELQKTKISTLAYKNFLESEVIRPLYDAHIALRQIRLPRVDNSTLKEDPLINSFGVEEVRKYITPKENRVGKINIYGTEKVYNTIGHACVLMKKELEEYMDYDIGSYCKDDWTLGQKLMIQGCDPLPRRRCLTRASKLYRRPYPINESLWRTPEGGNVRWANYLCKNYACLSSKNPKRGYSKCSGCFEMEKEKLKWVNSTNATSIPVDFTIKDVLGIKPGEMRIGLDFGVGTGTFAARMSEENVTIVSTALNLGAPFSETIALRGLIPLYMTLNQRLPFFDNTMDLIHTSGFMDGWMDLQLLDFILFDWDRVLRPGGLLWIDRFFCERKDLDDYMYLFLQFRYRKHKWAIAPKSKDEVFLSALLEKPPGG